MILRLDRLTTQLVFLTIQALCFGLIGCTTPGAIKIEKLEYPLRFVQKAVSDNLPAGKLEVSRNGREFLSEYFIFSGGDFVKRSNSSRRYQAKISVLGDRRPYLIEIIVYKELAQGQGSNGGYSRVGTDERIARIIKEKIRDYLSKRREDLNIIDDFRVF